MSENHADLNGLAAEVAEVGIERFGAGDGEEDETEHGQPDEAVVEQEACAVPRVERDEHVRVIEDVDEAADGEGDEPHDGDRPEIFGDVALCRATASRTSRRG